LTTYADALHQAGENKMASALFAKAEKIQQEHQSEVPWLYSLRGFQYSDLLIAQNRNKEVLERAEVWNVKKATNEYLDSFFKQLTLGRTYQIQGDFMLANRYLDQAVESLRKTGFQYYLPLGLLSRAVLYRKLERYKLASYDLVEIWEIVEASEMLLFKVDYHLEMARLLLVSDDEGDILAHIAKAERLINQTGYHRRDSELAALKAQL